MNSNNSQSNIIESNYNYNLDKELLRNNSFNSVKNISELKNELIDVKNKSNTDDNDDSFVLYNHTSNNLTDKT